ncbi:hypothetical protein EKO27_g4355 [Xylaria grammica]|uniref:Uncharacterized protein n=1 Tax=Xylaria grammica TaxID=363999 RepID=A0A439D8L6_9PEZI|nr:hypothetical protein EKO27_g4355 [Xylaria grammica]
MGKIFYGMGFLSTDQVVEYSAGDLLGHQYGREALDELINFLTKPANMGRIVVIMAGYTWEMNMLLSTSPVPEGIFQDDIIFENIPPDECISLLAHELIKANEGIDTRGVFADSASEDYIKIRWLFRSMQSVPSWSNARDVEHLAKRILSRNLELTSDGSLQVDPLVISSQRVIDCMLQMLKQQAGRYRHLGTGDKSQVPFMEPPLGAPATGPVLANPRLAQLPAATDSEMRTSTAEARSNIEIGINIYTKASATATTNIDILEGSENTRHGHSHREGSGEIGVSRAVLMRVLAAHQAVIIKRNQRKLDHERLCHKLESENAMKQHEGGSGDGEGLEAKCNEIREKLRDIEKEMQDEDKLHQALAASGPCENGYEYVRDGSGYRCTGGYHFIAGSEIPQLCS